MGNVGSNWKRHISYSNIGQYVFDMGKNKLPIISVGSGDGEYESKISQMFGFDIICIDPKPGSFSQNETVYLAPKYATVTDLIKEQPDIVGKCNLLLIWPNPDSFGTYDYEAIEALKPKEIVSVYAVCGAAGSSNFHSFVKNVGGPAEGKFANYDNDVPESDNYLYVKHQIKESDRDSILGNIIYCLIHIKRLS